jgi:signal peptidase I
MQTRRERITRIVILTGVSVAAPLLIGVLVCLREVVVRSGSMADTLIPGEGVVVERLGVLLGMPLYRGEIVSFRSPLDRDLIFLYRIVALPGDRVQMRNKELYRNGAECCQWRISGARWALLRDG